MSSSKSPEIHIEKPAAKAPDHAAKSAHSGAKKHRFKLSPGSRNLIILGIGATVIATLTTTLGLAIYHLSGDIYLDRSRPGYLPDEAEVEEEIESKPEEYTIDKSGKLDAETLHEYLKHLAEEANAVDAYKDPFSETPLSDEHLGIPQE